MALIKCVECGKEISDKAESCPNCGYPVYEMIAEKVDRKCEFCGELIGENELYCDACGMRVESYKKKIVENLKGIENVENKKSPKHYTGFIFAMVSLIGILLQVSRIYSGILAIAALKLCITYLRHKKEKHTLSIVGILISGFVLTFYIGYYIYIIKTKIGMI